MKLKICTVFLFDCNNCDTLRITERYLEDNILSNINIAEERMYAYSLLRKEVVRCVTKRSIRKNNPIVVFHSSVMRMSFSSRKSYQSVTVVTVKTAAELLSTGWFKKSENTCKTLLFKV